MLEIDPGRLLGPDDCQIEASEAELSLLACLREMGLAPHQAIARLVVGAGGAAASTPTAAAAPTSIVREP